jgi:hypothetical protein
MFRKGLNVQKEEEMWKVRQGLYSFESLFLDLPLKGALIMLTREPRARNKAPKPKLQPLTRTV